MGAGFGGPEGGRTSVRVPEWAQVYMVPMVQMVYMVYMVCLKM